MFNEAPARSTPGSRVEVPRFALPWGYSSWCSSGFSLPIAKIPSCGSWATGRSDSVDKYYKGVLFDRNFFGGSVVSCFKPSVPLLVSSVGQGFAAGSGLGQVWAFPEGVNAGCGHWRAKQLHGVAAGEAAAALPVGGFPGQKFPDQKCPGQTIPWSALFLLPPFQTWAAPHRESCLGRVSCMEKTP